jgi:DNA-directed RNA polymerase specialized sigma24 family protein
MPLRPKFHRLLGRKVNPMRHTDEQIEQAAARFEQLADDLDPDTVHVEETDDLRQVAVAADAVSDDEARLREAVQLARAHGRSWNQIAVALGVSRQAARQRFADKVA